jgi:hypothetical protein
MAQHNLAALIYLRGCCRNIRNGAHNAIDGLEGLSQFWVGFVSSPAVRSGAEGRLDPQRDSDRRV